LETIRSFGRIRLDSGVGDVSVVRWMPRSILLDVNLARETQLIVKQFYYPGWQGTIKSNDTNVALMPSGSAGMIELTAPPGQYKLTLVLQPLWQEVAGWILSGAGSLILIGLSVFPLVRRNRTRPPVYT